MKVFAHGKGRVELATNYLVRTDYHNRHEAVPEVLRGDPELTADLINSIDRKWKYTAGVLSWHPDDMISPEQEKELMDYFEKLAFAELEPEQNNILWVRHTHAKHHELHFVMPRMELATGKAFNPCPPNWQKHFDPLRDLYNIKENWARPDDPERKRLFTPPQADIRYNRLKRWGAEITKSETDEMRELLIEYTVKRIESGLITNRDELIKSFQELGLEINRKGKDYITVHDTESNKKIRLKGGIFNEDWRLGKESTRELTIRSQDAGAKRASELDRLRKELEAIHAKRAEYNRGRYKKDTAPLANILENTPEKLFDIPYFGDNDGRRNILWKQRTMLIPNDSNHDTASRIDDTFTRTRKTIENTTISQNLGDTSPHEKWQQLSYSSPWNSSQNRLDSGQTKSNQNREIKEHGHERNTEIPTGNIQQHRTEFQRQNGYSLQSDQGFAIPNGQVTEPNERITKTTKQLGTILERFDCVLQQITKLIPSLTRKIESLRVLEHEKSKGRRMGM